MYRLLYQSQAAQSLGEFEVKEIIKSCSEFNESNMITGLLCFDGVHFHQFLEGRQNNIAQLMDLIRQDRRHRRIKIIGQKPAIERAYLSWGFKWDNGNVLQEMEEALRS